jgi:hypothetical protein
MTRNRDILNANNEFAIISKDVEGSLRGIKTETMLSESHE